MTRIDDALAALADLHPKLIDLGLSRTFEILEVLGNPQDSLPPVIHIAGTNGKGSTAAFLRAMANEAGLRCHVYSSPHLCRFHERIRLSDDLIDDETLIDLLEEVKMRNQGKPITFFEVTTAAAFLAFSRVPADLVILETGLGGLLDSTNVIRQPAACVITPVAQDHEHFLGNDITEIGRTKAGIFKTGAPAIISAQSELARIGISDIAAQKNITTHWMGQAFDYEATPSHMSLTLDGQRYEAPLPSLRGAHQQSNAALAAAALHYSGVVPIEKALGGIAKAHWPGRVQKLTNGALLRHIAATEIWLDGAHNAHGAQALVEAMRKEANNGAPYALIIGALNTRPVADFLAQMAPIAQEVIAITIPDQEAALSAQEICEAARSAGLKSRTAPDIDHALSLVCDAPQILICGSLYLAGHVLTQNGTLPD